MKKARAHGKYLTIEAENDYKHICKDIIRVTLDNYCFLKYRSKLTIIDGEPFCLHFAGESMYNIEDEDVRLRESSEEEIRQYNKVVSEL